MAAPSELDDEPGRCTPELEASEIKAERIRVRVRRAGGAHVADVTPYTRVLGELADDAAADVEAELVDLEHHQVAGFGEVRPHESRAASCVGLGAASGPEPVKRVAHDCQHTTVGEETCRFEEVRGISDLAFEPQPAAAHPAGRTTVERCALVGIAAKRRAHERRREPGVGLCLRCSDGWRPQCKDNDSEYDKSSHDKAPLGAA